MSPEQTIASTLELLRQSPALAFFVELALKSSLILLLCLLLSFVFYGQTAARRHLLWSVCVSALLCLPVFIAALPGFELAILPRPAPGAGTEPAPLFTAAFSSWPALRLLYLGGLTFCLLRILNDFGRILRLKRAATQCRDARALAQLDDILLDDMSDVEVALKQHPALRTPLSWGLLRPVIILPAGHRHWSDDKLRHVLLHETRHIQRLDWIGLLSARFACALYWYNPLVWYAVRRLAELAEFACDDAVLLQTRQHAGYAESLVSIARQNLEDRRGLLAKAMASSFLGTRVVAILDELRGRSVNDSALVLSGLLGGIFGSALLAALTLSEEKAPLNLYGNHPRLIRIALQPGADRSAAREHPAPAPRPELLLSLNFPETETIHVRPEPSAPATPDRLAVPEISLDQLQPAPDRHSPMLLYKRFPRYPSAARQAGIGGSTLIEYGVDREGRVSAPVVVASDPPGLFEASALKALREYRYEPPRINGRPVPIKGLRARFVFQVVPDPG